MVDVSSREREAAEVGAPSPHFLAHAEALKATATLGRILDLACGSGRHALAAAGLGLDVLALDRNDESLATLSRIAERDKLSERIQTRRVDLETGSSPDLPEERFGAILVFRYLHRPLAPWIASRLQEGGLLIYETFTTDHRALGWGPKSADFLLNTGELPGLFPELALEHFEEGPTREPRPAITARFAARLSR